MTSRLGRIGAYFLEPAAAPEREERPAAPSRPGDGGDVAAPGAWTSAVVLGAHAAVVPVAAACAGELRARDRAAAAALCVWRPAGSASAAGPAPPGEPMEASVAGSQASRVHGPVEASTAGPHAPPARGPVEAPAVGSHAPSARGPVEASAVGSHAPSARGPVEASAVGSHAPPARGPVEAPAARAPAGATTPGARRLAARLVAQGLPAAACGRLAWVELAADPDVAREQVARCLRVAAAPAVLAVAGPRPAAFEPLLAALDLAVAVLPAEAGPALRALALRTPAGRERAIVAPLAPGPPRWAAMAGLARLRSLPPLGGGDGR